MSDEIEKAIKVFQKSVIDLNESFGPSVTLTKEDKRFLMEATRAMFDETEQISQASDTNTQKRASTPQSGYEQSNTYVNESARDGNLKVNRETPPQVSDREMLLRKIIQDIDDHITDTWGSMPNAMKINDIIQDGFLVLDTGSNDSIRTKARSLIADSETPNYKKAFESCDEYLEWCEKKIAELEAEKLAHLALFNGQAEQISQLQYERDSLAAKLETAKSALKFYADKSSLELSDYIDPSEVARVAIKDLE